MKMELGIPQKQEDWYSERFPLERNRALPLSEHQRSAQPGCLVDHEKIYRIRPLGPFI